MNISSFGAAYVALVTGCMDADAAKIAAVRRRFFRIYESGFAELVTGNACACRLAFSARGVVHTEVRLIALAALPACDGGADLYQVLQVARVIEAGLTQGKSIVNKLSVSVRVADSAHAAVVGVLRTLFGWLSSLRSCGGGAQPCIPQGVKRYRRFHAAGLHRRLWRYTRKTAHCGSAARWSWASAL